MYFSRHLSLAINEALNQFPAVLVTGPRQSGKTTMLRHEWPEAGYATFDDPLERDFAREDPNGFLDRFDAARVIFDEIQYVPELLPYLKVRIDRERDRHGSYLLTGSQQFSLMANVSESLAGRIAIFELLPFSRLEAAPLCQRGLEASLWQSSYPEPALAPEKRDLWIQSYLQTYVERDVRQLKNIQDLRAFETLLQICAAHHGRVLSKASVARDTGISEPTVKSWITVLEASYMLQLVPPYFENFGKRLRRAPKLFFHDVAIVAWLTRQPSAEAALAGAMGGPLFEGSIMAEATKVLTMTGLRPELYFWRSHDGLEVDLLLRIRGKLLPIEIKLTATPRARHVEPLGRFRALAGEDRTWPGLLVCRVDERRDLPGGHLALPWHEFPGWLYKRVSGRADP